MCADVGGAAAASVVAVLCMCAMPMDLVCVASYR